MNIDHTAIWVVDLEREKDFFLRFFDCSVNELYTNPVKLYSSYFIRFTGGGRIELMKREGMGQTDRKELPGYSHIAIDVGSRDEVDNLTELMRGEGVFIISSPRVTGDGYYESVILDPENNRIEIISQ